MTSKVQAGNETATETPKTVTESNIRAIDAVETERTVEPAPEKEVEPLYDHSTVTELTPAAETNIPKKMHSPMPSKVTPETEIPLAATVESERTVGAEVKESPEKETKPVADHPTVAGVAETTISKKKWPGWPGYCVIRVIVPVNKIESIIGRNGDIIKKMSEDTKANISILEGPVYVPYRIVQIYGKEDIEAPLSTAMDAVIRVFKCVNGFPENESDGVLSIPNCSIRLLLTSMQATCLIGRQGSTIQTIQNTGCYVRILSCDEVSTLSANSDDRVFDLQGESLQVLQALEAVHRHLHMFLVDHSILSLSEKTVTFLHFGS